MTVCVLCSQSGVQASQEPLPEMALFERKWKLVERAVHLRDGSIVLGGAIFPLSACQNPTLGRAKVLQCTLSPDLVTCKRCIRKMRERGTY